MLVGYSRVSTPDQTPELQIDALNAEGCQKIFSDVASGAKTARPGLSDAISYCREGDTLVYCATIILTGDDNYPDR